MRVHYFFQRHADAYRIGGRFETRVALQAGIAVSGEVARAAAARGCRRADNRKRLSIRRRGLSQTLDDEQFREVRM